MAIEGGERVETETTKFVRMEIVRELVKGVTIVTSRVGRRLLIEKWIPIQEKQISKTFRREI